MLELTYKLYYLSGALMHQHLMRIRNNTLNAFQAHLQANDISAKALEEFANDIGLLYHGLSHLASIKMPKELQQYVFSNEEAVQVYDEMQNIIEDTKKLILYMEELLAQGYRIHKSPVQVKGRVNLDLRDISDQQAFQAYVLYTPVTGQS